MKLRNEQTPDQVDQGIVELLGTLSPGWRSASVLTELLPGMQQVQVSAALARCARRGLLIAEGGAYALPGTERTGQAKENPRAWIEKLPRPPASISLPEMILLALQ